MWWRDPETGEERAIFPTSELGEELAAHSQSHCTHEDTELRWATNTTGGRHLRYQCLECGELRGNALPKHKAVANIPEADPDKFDKYLSDRRNDRDVIYRKHFEKQRKEHADFRGQHAAYLQTPEWQARRAKVLARANGQCEGCGDQPATQVHHLTYAHWMDELLFELVAVCDACHGRCHPPDPPEQV